VFARFGIAELAGVEHVGLGTDVDLDGRDQHPAVARYDLDGIQYEKKAFDIVEGLVRRKYSSESIRLILGGNFQRALGEIFDQTITTSRSVPLGVRTR